MIASSDKNNVQLTPLGSGRPITTHLNICKKVIVCFPHLELPQEPLQTEQPTNPTNNYWDYEPPSELHDDLETSHPTHSTEDDQLIPSAPPAEDRSSDKNVEQQPTQPTHMTRSTADPSKLTPYVYDALSLEKRLSKIIEEKRNKKVEEDKKKCLRELGLKVL